jgi:hypothetical protein
MSHKKVTKRQRHNRVVRVLAELYEFDYWLTLKLYNHFDRCIASTKLHLKWFRQSADELDFIDSHNYSF